MKERVDLKFGQFLAAPEPGEEIVIAGVSGSFPDSSGLLEFSDKLYNKIDMVTDDDRRWTKFNAETPQRSGKMYDVEKFDAGFFGYPHIQVSCSDPMSRICLERAIESILDAGLNPADLAGTKTGVYLGVSFSDSERHMYDMQLENSYPILGCLRSSTAHKISHHLKLNGPAYALDTACSSSLFALEHAFKDLRMGRVDYALVGGLQLVLHPFITLQFFKLGVLSLGGTCKSFDESGDGYVRSECVSMFFLQRKKDAKRDYCQLLHIKTNDDGFKSQGVNFPSRIMQQNLFEEVLEESGIDHLKISFLEAHGTGTKVGDPEECAAIDAVFTKNRKTPLMIGSVKSNMGHAETSSGMCCVSKVILAFENDLIPPNIHFNTPRHEIHGIVEGRLKVVTEPTPFEDDNGLVAINSFGFGGANCHTLVLKNFKEKVKKTDDIPRLVCVSGRTKESIEKLLDSIILNKLDKEHVGLIHEIFAKNIHNHIYRGYSICTETDELTRSSNFYKIKDQELTIIFSNIQEDWQKIGKDLLIIPVFAATIQRINRFLSRQKLALIDAEAVYDKNNMNMNHLSCIAIQLGIASILKDLQLPSKKVIGLGTNQLVALYYQNQLQLEDVIAVATPLAEVNTESKECIETYLVNSSISQLPGALITKSIGKNTLITGPHKEVSKIIKLLTNKNIQTEKLGQQTILSTKGREFLIKKLNNPKLNKVIEGLDNEYFFTTVSSIKPDTTILEIGQSKSKQILHFTVDLIQCNQIKNRNTAEVFLACIGRLYELGYQPQLQCLYPKIEFPVSRGTPMIAPYISWNHEKDWYVPDFRNSSKAQMREKKFRLPKSDEDWTFVFGHTIDGRILFPATGYLRLAWITFAILEGLDPDATSVTFESCKFVRSTIIQPKVFTFLNVRVQKLSGNFEIRENEQPIVTGKIIGGCNFETHKKNVTDEAKLVMNSKDVYKELSLRGYYYKDEFQLITKMNIEATEGMIKWHDNWVTYIDNMMQMKLAGSDTRLLYVPVSIDKLSIDPIKHEKICSELGENPEIPVFSYPGNIIQSGGCEIRGIWVSSIPRKKQTVQPVLETYKFVPNVAHLPLDQAIRVVTQIILEDSGLLKVEGVELVDEAAEEIYEPLSPIVNSALEDQPMIQPILSIFTKRPFEELPKNIEVVDKTLGSENNLLLVVGSKLLSRPFVIDQANDALKDEGFILSREPLDADLPVNKTVNIIVCYTTPTEKLILLKRKPIPQPITVINISSLDNMNDWFSKLQLAIQSKKNITVVADNNPESGIMGFINCLRREPGNTKIRCVFIRDEGLTFNMDDPLFAEQLNKNMCINVYQNKTWGTYRHLLLEPPQVLSPHIYCSQKVQGDLLSLHWKEGPLRDLKNSSLIYCYYASLNFKDVMIASGRINIPNPDRIVREAPLGMEYVGRDQNGKRVMTNSSHRGISTLTESVPAFTVEIPDDWSMEEAATIPCVYITAIYSFLVITTLKKEESVLIHSATGGVGQAAINIAHYYGCKIYVTVGTPEKREFLKSIFPFLTDDVIFSSRDDSFEYDIKKATKGRGVDVILNSLADELLFASVRCLAKRGRFLEIGKYNLFQNSRLPLHFFENDQSYHGITVDSLDHDSQWTVRKFLEDLIKTGAVKPTNRTVFEVEDLEKAFRYMTTGKHTGKVLIKFRDEEDQRVLKVSADDRVCDPGFCCNSDMTQVILGGLGGFGLELADWFVLRGAKNIVLTSRYGVKTGYQQYRIRIWKSYGVNVIVSTADVTTKKGCQKLLDDAARLGPIESIFNLAVVLKDALFEDQTVENFRISLDPKATATCLLDELTRSQCPDLKHFVVFSSVSSGRGNAGQTNYGLSNSIMERICEKRHREGLPGVAIQWGAIGEVGLVAEMQAENIEITIGGTLQQRILDCMKCLDIFLCQKNPVVSSMVVAEKKSGLSGSDAVTTVASILGLKDINSVSRYTALAELGMDSMTAVEIKQTLERDFDIFLNPKTMRELTFSKLMDIQSGKDKQDAEVQDDTIDMQLLFKCIGNEMEMSQPVVKMPCNDEGLMNPTEIIFFPGIEGVTTSFEEISQKINARVFGLNYLYEFNDGSIMDLASCTLGHVRSLLKKDEPFIIVAYSFGSLLAMEVVQILESEGYQGQLIIFEGGPMIAKEISKSLLVENDHILETQVLLHFISLYCPPELVKKAQPLLLNCPTLEEKINKLAEDSSVEIPFSTKHIYDSAKAFCNKIKCIIKYEIHKFEIKSKITLIKAVKTFNTMTEDYELGTLTGQKIDVVAVEGNHYTVLQNLEVALAINQRISS